MFKDQLVEVRKNHFFDIERLQAWLNKNFPDYGKIKYIKQFIGGQSNPTFFVLFKSKNSCTFRQ